MNKLAVVALGGNAILRGNQLGTIEEQSQNSKDTLSNLLYLIEEGYDMVISHGNGPQVGNILMRNDAGEELYNIAQMPLDICVADSQGGIGYMLEKELRNLLKEKGINKEVVTLVTQVVVDKNDPAFQNPTKRVGKIYNSEQAEKLRKDKGWEFKSDPKKEGGFRRVVASPKPIRVLNDAVIEQLVRQGIIVITVGGGGVPVYIDENNNIKPSEAVIDKDLASAVIGAKLEADELYILTDVPFVYTNYNTPQQEKLELLNKVQIEKYIADGTFGEGDMAPKIKACLNFVENGGKKAVITEATKLSDKSFGTKIVLK